ncbi:MAG: pseudouridine synthase [Kiritimatiellia bacterium]|nr:pseudouridine synthase [Kiritimatiellia bacterium]
MDFPKPNRPSDPRLQKVLASCGFGSRRFCETLISSGRVRIDGRAAVELGVRVNPDIQVIEVDGRRVRVQRFEYLLFHKPRGILCTSRDPGGRRTFLDCLPDLGVRLVTAGRLDAESEGLLLVTNDGDLIQSLIHPSRGVDKTYRVEMDRPLSPADARRFTVGISIEGQLHRVVSIQPLSRGPGGPERNPSAGYELVLHQGLNRQIRRMAEAVGRRVLRLQRVRLGPLHLGDLAPGAWRRLTPEELRSLRTASEPRSRSNSTSAARPACSRGR